MSKVIVERINGKTCSRGKYPVEEGKIIIKATGGLGQGDKKYTPPFDPTRLVRDGKLDKGYYIDGTDQLLSLSPDGDPPAWTAEHIIKASSVKLLEKQGKIANQESSLLILLLFLILAAVVGFGILTLIGSGVINLG